LRAAAARFVLLASCFAGLAGATPAPHSSALPIRVPGVALHAEYEVEVNRLGQVTRVAQSKITRDSGFNIQTYGNALQVVIRTDDGKAVAGKYRLTYDYDPATVKVRRRVELLQRGGVDADAPGAVTRMLHDADQAAKARPPANGTQPTPKS
jgi:hypothetical protein